MSVDFVFDAHLAKGEKFGPPDFHFSIEVKALFWQWITEEVSLSRDLPGGSKLRFIRWRHDRIDTRANEVRKL